MIQTPMRAVTAHITDMTEVVASTERKMLVDGDGTALLHEHSWQNTTWTHFPAQLCLALPNISTHDCYQDTFGHLFPKATSSGPVEPRSPMRGGEIQLLWKYLQCFYGNWIIGACSCWDLALIMSQKEAYGNMQCSYELICWVLCISWHDTLVKWKNSVYKTGKSQ